MNFFSFFSYEGLRLRVPFTRTEIVPSSSLRASAIPAVAPLLNAYPLPNEDDVAGVPTATAVSTFSDPSVLDATSLRLDYTATPKLSLFIRGNYGPSNGAQNGAFDFFSRATVSHTIANLGTVTAGATYLISSSLLNDFRLNFSQSKGATVVDPTNFGGATVPSQQFLFSSNPKASLQDAVFDLVMLDGSSGYFVGNDATNHQNQLNLVEAISWSRGYHDFKFGVDYRRLTPTNIYRSWDIVYLANSFAELAEGRISQARVDTNDTSLLRPVFTNVSLYAQDSWRVRPRLTLTYGVRWDYDPPPSENSGHPFFTATNLNDPANVALAPQGTPLWNASKRNFAPRLGFAYMARNEAGKELVFRGGAGIYFGLGNQQGAQGTLGVPYSRDKTFFGVDCGCGGIFTFPISAADGAPVPFTLNLLTVSCLHSTRT
jgi:TonB dependent receptor